MEAVLTVVHEAEHRQEVVHHRLMDHKNQAVEALHSIQTDRVVRRITQIGHVVAHRSHHKRIALKVAHPKRIAPKVALHKRIVQKVDLHKRIAPGVAHHNQTDQEVLHISLAAAVRHINLVVEAVVLRINRAAEAAVLHQLAVTNGKDKF